MLSKTIGSRTLQIATDTDHLNDARRKESEEQRSEPERMEEDERETAGEPECAGTKKVKSSGESLQSVLTWSRRQVN